MARKEERDEDGSAVSQGAGSSAGVVHLGFVESIEDMTHLEQVAFRSANYNDWDGGQLGGCPSWLDPQHIPHGPLLCTHNPEHGSLSFVCQIYAPVEDSELGKSSPPPPPPPPERIAQQERQQQQQQPKDRAFHRALYVFACAKCCCAGDSSMTKSYDKDKNNNNNKPRPPCVRVLRAQLPQSNPYYPRDPSTLSIDELNAWKAHRKPMEEGLCQVCGLRATYKCPLQKHFFCGKSHQKEYFRHIFQPLQQMQQQSDGPGLPEETTPIVQELPSLYPIAEIVVEEEEKAEESSTPNNKDNTNETQYTTLFPSSTDDADETDDEDEDLEQDDLNRMVRGKGKSGGGSVSDPVTVAFLESCRSNPDQVLRYRRWPISEQQQQQVPQEQQQSTIIQWFRQDQQPPVDSPPPCPFCGARRKFEFQLMPQMLHYLLRRKISPAAIQEPTTVASKEEEEMKAERDWQTAWNQAMQVADSWIEQAPPEFVPPCLVEAKDAATRRYQEHKLMDSRTATNNLDFGVVAIYTCTASCDFAPVFQESSTLSNSNKSNDDNENENSKNNNNNNNNKRNPLINPLDPSLGSYREEYAWVQTSW
ncbi:hypothetical protein ACA910_005640 [Epithemia clementina (nom. ined.)]